MEKLSHTLMLICCGFGSLRGHFIAGVMGWPMTKLLGEIGTCMIPGQGEEVRLGAAE